MSTIISFYFYTPVKYAVQWHDLIGLTESSHF